MDMSTPLSAVLSTSSAAPASAQTPPPHTQQCAPSSAAQPHRPAYHHAGRSDASTPPPNNCSGSNHRLRSSIAVGFTSGDCLPLLSVLTFQQSSAQDVGDLRPSAPTQVPAQRASHALTVAANASTPRWAPACRSGSQMAPTTWPIASSGHASDGATLSRTHYPRTAASAKPLLRAQCRTINNDR